MLLMSRQKYLSILFWGLVSLVFAPHASAKLKLSAHELPLAKQCTKVLRDHGYWTLKGARKAICKQAASQAGVDALEVIASQGHKIRDIELLQILSMERPTAAPCLSQALSRVPIDIINRVSICKRVQNEAGLGALDVITKSSHVLADLDAAASVTTATALQCMRSFRTQDYAPTGQHSAHHIVTLCQSEPSASGLAFFQRLLASPNLRRALSTAHYALVARLEQEAPQACATEYATRGRKLDGAVLNFCKELRSAAEVKALQALNKAMLARNAPLRASREATKPILDVLAKAPSRQTQACILTFVEKAYDKANFLPLWLPLCVGLASDAPLDALPKFLGASQGARMLAPEDLQLFLQVGNRHTAACLADLKVQGYALNTAQSKICHKLRSEEEVAAHALAAQSKVAFSEADFYGLLQVQRQAPARRCLEAFIKHGHNIFSGDRVHLCKKVKDEQQAALVERLASANQVDQAVLDTFLATDSPKSQRCLQAFTNHNYDLFEDDRIAFCMRDMDESMLQLVERLTAQEEPFSLQTLHEGVAAEQECRLIWSEVNGLSIDQLPKREVFEIEASCYKAIEFYLGLSNSQAVAGKRSSIIAQLRFAAGLFEARGSFIESARRGEYQQVWYYSSHGAEGAFHAELVKGNTYDNQDVYDMQERLNYVHNALLWGFEKSRRDGKLDLFFSKAFDPTRYCIDARTEVMIDFLKLQENGYDPLADASSRDALINKLLELHQGELEEKGGAMTEKTIKAYLQPYLGKVFQNEKLGERFSRDCIEQAQILCII